MSETRKRKHQEQDENVVYIGVVGGRDLTGDQVYKRLCEEITKHIPLGKQVCIVSGGATGIDTLAERFAQENKYELLVFKPKAWGPKYLLERNKQIVDKSNLVVAYPSKNSKGTWHTVRYAESKNKKVFRVYEK